MTSSDSLKRDFVDWAVELSMLTSEQADRLRDSAQQQAKPIEVVAITGNHLSAQDIDVIETMQRPLDCVPGYEIIGLLGRGGMGVVYRARQVTLNREVALKTIPIGAQQAASVARFEQEAQLAARLHHPNIIAIHDFGRNENRVYTAMELVVGQDGDDYVAENHPLAESLVWGVIKQAASGLASAAAAGIIHRDIKPANLLLCEPPDGYDWPAGLPMVKIADFGLASLSGETSNATRLTQEGTTIGSPHYMAPEQLRASSVDLRADIYALGATAFHMLAGRPPFESLSLSQIVGEKFEPPPRVEDLREVSEASATLVRRLLDPNVETRIQTYEQLLEELRDLSPFVSGDTQFATAATQAQPTVTPTLELKTATTSTQPEITSPPSEPAPRRFSFVALAATAVVILAVLAGAGYGLSFLFTSEPVYVKPNFQAGEYAASLFDGRDLEGWTMIGGSWDVEPNEDGANVLVGSNGVIRRSILQGKSRNSPPLRLFRLTYSTMLVDAESAELHFGIERDERNSCYRLEITDDEISLKYGGDKDAQTLFTQSVESAKSRLVQLERGRTRWWISIDGKEFTSAPVRRSQQLPQIRFAARQGKVRFSDVFVFELRPTGGRRDNS